MNMFLNHNPNASQNGASLVFMRDFHSARAAFILNDLLRKFKKILIFRNFLCKIKSTKNELKKQILPRMFSF